MDAFEREERILQEQLDHGEITISEYNRELRELERDYADAAHEAAERAHYEEL